MALTLIEPTAIQIAGALPLKCRVGMAFYLGYERNAYHSTLVNKYRPNSISFDVAELQRHAESQKVQGSVFHVESVPLLVTQYKSSAFGIAPINHRSRYEYDHLANEIRADAPSHFWQAIPRSGRDWLLVFSLGSEPHRWDRYVPSMLMRNSNPHYWWPREAKSHDEFLRFAHWLSGYFTRARAHQKKRRPQACTQKEPV
jgi:hypothetical protein